MINTVMLSAMTWVTSTVGSLVARIKEERGQDIMEYAVLAGAIALVAGFVLIGGTVAGIDIAGAVEDFGVEVTECIGIQDGCGS